MVAARFGRVFLQNTEILRWPILDTEAAITVETLKRERDLVVWRIDIKHF